MASESPEDTTPQLGDEGTDAWRDDGGYGAADIQQSSHTEHYSHHQAQDLTTSVDPAPNDSGDSPSDADDDSGEYDPESVIITTNTPPAPAVVAEPSTATSSPRPSKKPKKAGGFIVGSSDDEDDTTPPPAASNTLKPNPPDIQSHTFSHSPLQQSTTSQDIAGNSTSSNPVAQVSNGHANVSPATNTSASKSRLPTDIMGILEDRVKDDPRGEIDSWLGLIEEYRRRNMIHDTRAVYDRFFSVFPQSVCCH